MHFIFVFFCVEFGVEGDESQKAMTVGFDEDARARASTTKGTNRSL